VSEQVRTGVPEAKEPVPPNGKKRRGLLVGIVGGFLTAGAVVLALNGGVPFIKKGSNLSLVAPRCGLDADDHDDAVSVVYVRCCAKADK
jgi:hypothetical protein